MYLVTDEINCRGSDTTYTYSLDVKFIDEPLCLATSCDISDFVEQLDAEVEELAQAQEEASLISNYECTSPNSVVTGPDGLISAAFDLQMKVPLGMASTMAILTWLIF